MHTLINLFGLKYSRKSMEYPLSTLLEDIGLSFITSEKKEKYRSMMHSLTLYVEIQDSQFL